MKVLIVYPNMPMMMSPALSVAYFTDICDKENVEVQLFETTNYDDKNIVDAQTRKEQMGAGRGMVDYSAAFDMIKPTEEMIPDFIEYVGNYKPDLLLFSTVEDTWFDTIKLLKAVHHLNIPHIVGGVFPINAPEVVINNEYVTALSRYEGEYVIRDIIRKMQNGEEWSDVKGIWYKMPDGKIKKNQFQPLVDLEEFYPQFRLYNKEARFMRPVGGKVRKTIGLETYRGCPYQCTYCNSPMTRSMDKKFVRRESVPHTREKILKLVEQHNPEFWFILDDSFTSRPKRELFPLLETLKEVGIPWWCNTRLDDIDEEILSAMKEAYCERIQFGIESGNEWYRMNMLKRKVKQEVYIEKAKVLNASGIPYGLNVIIGMPLETKEMVFDTVRLVKQIGGYDGLGISIFLPYHGTELRKVALENNFIPETQIGSNGGFQGLPFMKMPKPYMQLDDMSSMMDRFKLYAYFNESYWDEITNATDLSKFEEIYKKEFFASKTAASGDQNVNARKKSKYACESSDQTDFFAEVDFDIHAKII